MHFDHVLVEALEHFLRLKANHLNQLKVLCLLGSIKATLRILLLRVGAIFAEALEQCRLDWKLLDTAKYFIRTIVSFALTLRSPPKLTPANTTEVK